jgi:hypothetical protein
MLLLQIKEEKAMPRLFLLLILLMLVGLDNVNTDTWTLGFNYLFKGDDIKFMVNWLISDVPVLPDIQNKVLFRMQVIF